MGDLRDARVAVAGAGAIGSAVALALARAGAKVTLCDPAALGDNASGIAAGMLAPGLEAALECAATDVSQFLSHARDAWPAFAGRLEVDHALMRCGALWLGDAEAAARLAQLIRLGFAATAIDAAGASDLSPGLAGEPGVWIADDWRIDVPVILEALSAELSAAGVASAAQAIVDTGLGWAKLADGRVLRVDCTVYAGGHPAEGAPPLAADLVKLVPIKGQIVRFSAGAAPSGGPLVRSGRVYVAPSRLGPAVGATMEVGVADREVDSAAVSQLARDAALLFPALAAERAQGSAAVRTATADGLPLVGASATPGLFLATGARRNGWLLAPLIAEMTVAAIGDPAPIRRPGEPRQIHTGLTINGEPAPMAVESIRGVVSAAIEKASQATGVDFGFLVRTAKRESGFNPQAQAKTSSAAGLFQFVEQTWLGALKQHGSKYGYARYADLIQQGSDGRFRVTAGEARKMVMELRLDPRAASLMAGELASDHASYLRGRVGRAPTNGELYAAHFLGPKGSARLIETYQSNPRASAASVFPDAAAANPTIFYRSGRAATIEEVYANLTHTGGAEASSAGQAPEPDGFLQYASARRMERKEQQQALTDFILRGSDTPSMRSGIGGGGLAGSLFNAEMLKALSEARDQDKSKV